jgi:Zn finger protein HypA/HybF involved in hydrogenase expression
MSLFSSVGRKVEETKRALLDDESASYECAACSKPVDGDYEYCPHCGEASVRPVPA